MPRTDHGDVTPRRAAGTLIKWAGSKRNLLHHLKAYWTVPGRRYVELFCGSAALYFELQPAKALLNDINSRLISTYRQVRRNPTRIYQQVISIPRTSKKYYAIREQIGTETSAELRAVHFLYLNRFAFNGIYRVNRAGKFNVPFSDQRNGRFPTETEFTTLARKLRHAKLSNCDFAEIAKSCGRGDFVYLDPPYVRSKRRTFEYSTGAFGLSDLTRLDEVLDGLNDRGAKFVLSYAQCPEIAPIAKKWRTQIVVAHRSVSANAKRRRRSRELIVSNLA